MISDAAESNPPSAMGSSVVGDFNKLQEFVRDASPAEWLSYAEELRDSAEFLWARNEDRLGVSLLIHGNDPPKEETRVSTVSKTYMLLAGFALENVLKGRLVSLDPSHVNQGVLSDELKSHDVTRLATSLPSMVLSRDERRFCDMATKAIPYWGRYPTPLKKSQVLPEVGIDETLRQAFEGLFQRLAHELYWVIRDGWDSGVGPKALKLRSTRYGDTIDPKEALF